MKYGMRMEIAEESEEKNLCVSLAGYFVLFAIFTETKKSSSSELHMGVSRTDPNTEHFKAEKKQHPYSTF